MWSLRPVVQHYPWGSRRAIPEFLGIMPDGRPYAEVWYGAHPSGPSAALETAPGRETPELPALRLDELIDSEAPIVLGPRVGSVFGRRMPFLVKLLAAGRPLSLQAHPDLRRAQDGYARERAANVPEGLRNYADDQHKPETLMAISRVHALSGFRHPRLVADDLRRLDCAALEPIVGTLLGPHPAAVRLAVAFEQVLRLTPDARAACLDRLRAVPAADGIWGEDLLQVGRELLQTYPDDAGVLAAMFLNPVDLSPGMALSTGAGIVHCYVSGFGLEVMASSDNVMRAGLTTKRVDVDELMAIVDFEPHSADVRGAELTWPQVGVGVERFTLPFAEYGLEVVDLIDPDGAYQVRHHDGPRVLLGLVGAVVVATATGRSALAPGAALLVGDGEDVTLSGRGRIAMVGVPS